MSAGDKAWDWYIKRWCSEPTSAQSFWKGVNDLENINEKIAKETFNKNKGKGPALSDKIWYDWHLTDEEKKDIETALPDKLTGDCQKLKNYKSGFSISKVFKIDGFSWDIKIYPAGLSYEEDERFQGYPATVVRFKDKGYWKQSFRNDIYNMTFEIAIKVPYSSKPIPSSDHYVQIQKLLSENYQTGPDELVCRTRQLLSCFTKCHRYPPIKFRAELVSIQYTYNDSLFNRKGALVTDKTEIDKLVHKYKRGVEEVKEELDEVKKRLRKQKQENESLKEKLAEFEMKKNKPESNDEDPIREWLTSVVKLPQYVDTFIEAGFDMESMVDVTMDDLKELKIDKLGHRKKLLKAIANMS